MTLDFFAGSRLHAALLASALLLTACGSDPAASKTGTDNSTADDGDGDDNGDGDAESTATKKDAGKGTSSAKVDAGRSTTTTAKPDAGVKPSTDDQKPSEGTTTSTDAGKTSGSDAGAQRDGGSGTSSQTDGGGGGDTGKSHPDLGKGDGSDVVTIGDSWMNIITNGGGIERGLNEASGQKYRNYALAGTKLLDDVIPDQYETAKRENPDIKTVVMTAGGNDILLGTNPVADPKAVIDMEPARLQKLWMEMAQDGVQDVIYIEYSEGGGNPDNAANVRYGIEKVGPACKDFTALRCHYMLSDPVIMMMLSLDGIHPTADGCTKLGKAAYDLMVSEGMRR